MRIIGNDPSVPRQAQAIASGTLANGKTVIVNSNGTVSAAASTGSAASVGSTTTFESGQVEQMGGTYDSNANRVVFCYKDDSNSDYGTAVAGAVSGTSITFGTPVVYSSINTDRSVATFDSNANKFAIFYYKNNVDTTHGIVGTVDSSDNSISFGSSTQFDGTSVNRNSCTFDSSNNKCVHIYNKYTPSSGARDGRAVVGTISGTSISFGSFTDFEDETLECTACTFDSNSNKVVIFFSRENNNSKYEAMVGTVSGTSISFGSAVEIDGTVRGNGISATFDTTSNKVVAVFKDFSASNKGKAVVGTVSGTSISFGTPVIFTNSTVGGDGDQTSKVGYDSTNNKVGIAFMDSTNVEGRFISGTVSGTSITFDSEQTYTTAGRPGAIAGCLYDDNADKFVVGYGETTSRIGRANVIQVDTLSTNVTSENYIGISRSGAADTKGAIINTQGAIADNLSGLTAGQSYFVQNDGTLSTSADSPSVFAGTAVSATKLIVKG
tara:strand:- start:1270 stop:2754 length:1485 start_codon:yes stop_codon:yes gene_type:complete